MTELERHFREARPPHTATTPIVLEYVLVLVLVLIVGAVALAEAAGAFDSFVHSISFTV